MARLITKKVFADACGVSKSAITQQCASGKSLSDAVFRDEIDLDHIDAKLYLFRKKVGLEKLFLLGYSDDVAREYDSYFLDDVGDKAVVDQPGAKVESDKVSRGEGNNRRGSRSHVGFFDEDDFLEYYGNKTLNQIIKEFGTDDAFSKYVNSLKSLGEIESRKFDLALKRKKVVDKELVEKRIISHLDTCNRRLLIDLPRNIVRRIVSGVEMDSSNTHLESDVKEMISQVLKDTKSKVNRGLANVG